MNRFIPIILLVGIIFNCAAVVVFKIKTDRRRLEDFNNLSSSVHDQIQSFSRDALRSIDNYFLSNRVERSSSVEHVESSSSLPRSPVYDTVGDWDFIFWLFDGEPRARVVNGFSSIDYKVGDEFPRGGLITSIHPDGVSLNNFFWVNNRSSSSRPFSRSENIKPKTKDIAQNGRPHNTVR